jgi:hypothetical protein
VSIYVALGWTGDYWHIWHFDVTAGRSEAVLPEDDRAARVDFNPVTAFFAL